MSEAVTRTNGADMGKQANTDEPVEVDAAEDIAVDESADIDTATDDTPAPADGWTRDAIARLQASLVGVDVDGTVGPQTVRAIQRASGIRATGIIDTPTRDALNRRLAELG